MPMIRTEIQQKKQQHIPAILQLKRRISIVTILRIQMGIILVFYSIRL